MTVSSAIQWIAVVLILAAAIVYAVKVFLRNLRDCDDPCHGCTGCALKKARKRRPHKNGCPDRKIADSRK